MPKFFVDKHQIENETIYITGEDVNHISNVLRLNKDDELLVCNKENNINKLLNDNTLAEEMVKNQRKYINQNSAKDLINLIKKEFK